MRPSLLLLSIAFLSACGTNSDDAPAVGGADTPSVNADQAAAQTAVQTAVARYANATDAVADGFIRDPRGMCVTADMVGLPASAGAMGVHYLHPGRLGLVEGSARADGTDDRIVWAEPEVLVYEPQADGSELLVAVEYLVFEGPWLAAGNTTPPNYFGTDFVHMADDPASEMDEAHGFANHYELHIWTPRDNPTGMFAEFNPAVSCAHAPMADMG